MNKINDIDNIDDINNIDKMNEFNEIDIDECLDRTNKIKALDQIGDIY